MLLAHSICNLFAIQLSLLAFVCRHGKLHPSFPTEGKHAATLDEQQVDTYLTMFDEDEKSPKSCCHYDSNKGNSNLKFHLSRYHNDYWQDVLHADDDGKPTASGRKRPSNGVSKPGEVALGTFSLRQEGQEGFIEVHGIR